MLYSAARDGFISCAIVTPGSEQRQSLEGTKVLVIEDEFFIADDLRRALTKAGAQVVGPYSDLTRAEEAIAAGGFDCCILDLNLNGESGARLADRLIELNVPYALATGYGGEAVPGRLRDVPRVEKPFDPAAIVGVVARLGTQGARDN